MKNTPYTMLSKKSQLAVDAMAGELLEVLSEQLPDIHDDGILGKTVLLRALEVYDEAMAE